MEIISPHPLISPPITMRTADEDCVVMAEKEMEMGK
jgi:hypothetical protein